MDRQAIRVRDLLDYVRDMQADPQREARLARSWCRACEYADAVAGQAFTDSECESCGARMTFHTTRVDRYCTSCAQALDACAHCGSSIALVDQELERA